VSHELSKSATNSSATDSYIYTCARLDKHTAASESRTEQERDKLERNRLQQTLHCESLQFELDRTTSSMHELSCSLRDVERQLEEAMGERESDRKRVQLVEGELKEARRMFGEKEVRCMCCCSVLQRVAVCCSVL